MAEARTALDTSDIALIISDTGFPDDGDPTIAEEAAVRGVPLLMMSGRLERQEMYLREGVPFLAKPFGLSALRQQVRLVIGGDEEEPGHRLELKSSQAAVLRTEQGHG
jgi:DNA-binding response OmpR family regulator